MRPIQVHVGKESRRSDCMNRVDDTKIRFIFSSLCSFYKNPQWSNFVSESVTFVFDLTGPEVTVLSHLLSYCLLKFKRF